MGRRYIYIYILSLICFVRMDFWGKYRIEYEMRWSPFWAKHVKDSMFIHDLSRWCHWRQYNITWCFFSVMYNSMHMMFFCNEQTITYKQPLIKFPWSYMNVHLFLWIINFLTNPVVFCSLRNRYSILNMKIFFLLE